MMHAFTPEGLNLLQGAVDDVCAMIDPCPDRGTREAIARSVIHYAENGMNDREHIALCVLRTLKLNPSLRQATE